MCPSVLSRLVPMVAIRGSQLRARNTTSFKIPVGLARTMLMCGLPVSQERQLSSTMSILPRKRVPMLLPIFLETQDHFEYFDSFDCDGCSLLNRFLNFLFSSPFFITYTCNGLAQILVIFDGNVDSLMACFRALCHTSQLLLL